MKLTADFKWLQRWGPTYLQLPQIPAWQSAWTSLPRNIRFAWACIIMPRGEKRTSMTVQRILLALWKGLRLSFASTWILDTLWLPGLIPWNTSTSTILGL